MIKTPSENCDDGNLSAGDGCSASCGVESSFQCEDKPYSNIFLTSKCTAVPTSAPEDEEKDDGDLLLFGIFPVSLISVCAMMTKGLTGAILANNLSQLKTGQAIWAVYDFALISKALLLISSKNEIIN